jgi:hypothetical protein
MNSAHPQMPPGPKLSKRQREEKDRDEFFAQITSENLQLKRTLWLVLRTFAKQTAMEAQLTIDQAEMSLLWDLQYSEVEGAPTKLTLTAHLMPEASDEQIDQIRQALLADPAGLKAALDAAGLPNHPSGYLQGKLMEGPNGITWDYTEKKFKPTAHSSPAQEPPNPPEVAV